MTVAEAVEAASQYAQAHAFEVAVYDCPPWPEIPAAIAKAAVEEFVYGLIGGPAWDEWQEGTPKPTPQNLDVTVGEIAKAMRILKEDGSWE
jgi:hypothetical protein